VNAQRGEDSVCKVPEEGKHGAFDGVEAQALGMRMRLRLTKEL
jgi:hypothetical protein